MRIAIVCLLGALALAACGRREPAAAPPFRPTASIQEIMQAIVDPSADALWESVSSTVTSAGTQDQQPRTPEQWHAVRLLALRLAEAANLLLIEGREVARQGRQLEDAHVPGTLGPDAIQKKIAAQPQLFAARALALHEAALQTLAAIDTQDIARFSEAGGKLDQACEACHKQYWYPNDKRPTE